MRTTNAWRWAAALGLAMGLFAGLPQVAAAQSYDELLRKALTEYNNGNWTEARVLFRAAHEQNPNARTLRGMGVTAYQERRYALAIGMLRQALIDERRPLTPAMRAEVEEVIATALSFVATLRIERQPAEAVLDLDGTRVVPEPDGTLLVDPGPHELVVSAEGYELLSRRVQAEAGTKAELSFVLVPVGSAAAAGPAEGAPASPPGVADGAQVDEGRGGRLFTWVALGAAAAFGVAAGGFWAAGNGQVADVEEACQAQGGCTQQEADRRFDDSSADLYETLTSVSLGLSAASLVAAGVLFFVEGRPASAEKVAATARGASVAITPLGVAVGGRF